MGVLKLSYFYTCPDCDFSDCDAYLSYFSSSLILSKSKAGTIFYFANLFSDLLLLGIGGSLSFFYLP